MSGRLSEKIEKLQNIKICYLESASIFILAREFVIVFHVQSAFWEIKVGKNYVISSDLHIFPVKFTLADFLSSRKIIILYKLLFS